MKALELAKICLEHPGWDVSIRIEDLDNEEDFDIMDEDNEIVLCVNLPKREDPDEDIWNLS